MNKKLEINNIRFHIPLFIVSCLLFSLYIAGVYYTRYEIITSLLLSGKLTPGMPFNDYFYLAHIFTIKIYSLLYSNYPNFPWSYSIQIFNLSLSLHLLFRVFSDGRNNKIFYLCILPIITSIILYYFTFYLHFQTSFLTALCASIYIIHQKKIFSTKVLAAYAVLLFAILTRIEAASIAIITVSFFYLIVLKKNTWIAQFQKLIKIFYLPYIVIISLVVWFSLDKSQAESFYKKIEPDVEYHLAENDNIITISFMESKIDSFRYMAVNENIWGDATTNNAEFLRSLIPKNKFQNKLKTVRIKLSEFYKENFIIILISNLMLIVSMFILYENKSSIQLIALFIFKLFIYALIFSLSVFAKISAEAIFSMHVSTIFLFLYILHNVEYVKEKRKITIVLTSFALLFFTLNISTFYFKVNKERDKHIYIKKEFEKIQKDASNKILYLNKESVSILYSNTPPKNFNFNSFNNIIIFDSQHISTIEPYRTYLEAFCNCDPNNYKEFFHFVKNQPSSVFPMSESYKNFITEYLWVVHQLEINFAQINQNKYMANYLTEPLRLYQIN